MLLPIIFEWVAVNYEHHKTYSDVQHSILQRYFYYQLANIYISVTAGSIWSSLAEIIEHPTNILPILGKSLPTMVGYFVSLLVTKILAGLPMVLLRSGALLRMLFLRACFSEKLLSQRELDEVYRPQYLLLGWEYPTQLLVILICFSYACIAPVILPVAAAYFGLALIIYKKQVLYVYTPRYESGGESFPLAMQRTLVGLLFGQITFIGYVILRQGHFEPLVVFPLPLVTWYMMSNFDRRFVKSSHNNSLERARIIDKEYSLKQESPFNSAVDIAESFSVHAYRQPVLNEEIGKPLPYRHGSVDKLKEEVDDILDLDTLTRMQNWSRRTKYGRISN